MHFWQHRNPPSLGRPCLPCLRLSHVCLSISLALSLSIWHSLCHYHFGRRTAAALNGVWVNASSRTCILQPPRSRSQLPQQWKTSHTASREKKSSDFFYMYIFRVVPNAKDKYKPDPNCWGKRKPMTDFRFVVFSSINRGVLKRQYCSSLSVACEILWRFIGHTLIEKIKTNQRRFVILAMRLFWWKIANLIWRKIVFMEFWDKLWFGVFCVLLWKRRIFSATDWYEFGVVVYYSYCFFL